MPIHRRELIASALALLTAPAFANDYPTRPVRILVPFAPGGGTDLITRTLADVIAKSWNASVVIENKPGGGTTIATQAAIAAAPDGYTLLAAANSMIVSPMLMPVKPYVWDRDLVPVSLFALSPHILVVHPSVPARTLPEFIAWTKAQGGKATFASFGNGSSNHLGFEMLKRELGIDITHIPYKGSAPAMNDLVAGHVNAMLGDLQNVSEQLQGGTLRAIAVANEKRITSLPDLPTLDELGVKGFTSKSWFGALAKTGTPPEIVAKWSSAFAEALKRPDVQQRIGALGIELIGASPEETSAFMTREAARMEDAIKQAGVKSAD